MLNEIISRVCPINQLINTVDEFFQSMFDLEQLRSKRIIENHLVPYLNTLRDDLHVVVEAPYIDKMYRDAYYNYYSSKLENYHRDTIRISFFDTKIDDYSFRDMDEEGEKLKILKDHYLGFLVLRPTFPKIIGRNALSPKAKKENNIICCLAKINSTANSIKLKVQAFPHASQDNQTITCAETTVWALLEYFGNKYPDYKPVLPSTINKLLHKFSYKRLIPSDGLTAEQVTYAVRELGFGAMIYSKKKQLDFDTIISMYVESGIPIIGVLKNSDSSIGHALNIVGREIDDPNEIIKITNFIELKGGMKLIDYNNIKRRYVFIDDNYPPFQVSNIDFPCKTYYSEERWHTCEIKSIIIPLHPKIYLDATRARKNFLQVLSSKTLNIKLDETSVIRVFLCSTRSYREYIATNKDLDIKTKELILSIRMSKFIWIAELSKLHSFKDNKCDGFLIQDATEPVEYSDKTMLSNHSILTGYMDGVVFRQDFGRFREIVTFAQPFANYTGNLN